MVVKSLTVLALAIGVWAVAATPATASPVDAVAVLLKPLASLKPNGQIAEPVSLALFGSALTLVARRLRRSGK